MKVFTFGLFFALLVAVGLGRELLDDKPEGPPFKVPLLSAAITIMFFFHIVLLGAAQTAASTALGRVNAACGLGDSTLWPRWRKGVLHTQDSACGWSESSWQWRHMG